MNPFVVASSSGDQLLTVLANGNVGVGVAAPAGLFDVNGKLTVLSGGNVGIGATNPGYKLEVNGTGSFAGNVRLVNAALYDNGNAFWLTSTALKYASPGIIGFTNSANASDAASVAISLGAAGKLAVGTAQPEILRELCLREILE